METLRGTHKRQEKIDGVFCDMPSNVNYGHAIVDGNIHNLIRSGLKEGQGYAFIENIRYLYHPAQNDDYVLPDIMVTDGRELPKEGCYRGTPRLIVETLSAATALRDETVKKDLYETAGVEEYWLVSPAGRSVRVYYLEKGRYVLTRSHILEEDGEEEAGTLLCPRAFPDVAVRLGDIFEGLD
ncbi:MAG: Uma2 family endonuclease [Lachnospiraceae bacterium]|jgi:Uma2 family endonuclease|nr:Uma2 family endonuclease [Lachnospiraceae bacterium]